MALASSPVTLSAQEIHELYTKAKQHEDQREIHPSGIKYFGAEDLIAVIEKNPSITLEKIAQKVAYTQSQIVQTLMFLAQDESNNETTTGGMSQNLHEAIATHVPHQQIR